jgi:surface polysaccharide O-acyltransferase-like enzyme
VNLTSSRHQLVNQQPSIIQYDAIRLVAILAIVLLHTAANGVNQLPFNSSDWWLANFIDSACRTGVPLFLMLTGALLLNRQGESNHNYYHRRWRRLALPVLVWTLIYLGWSQLKALWKHQPIDLSQQLWQVITGHPYFHLWFVYMLIGLYAVLPVLRQYWQRLTLPQQLWLTTSCLLLQQGLLLVRFIQPTLAADVHLKLPDWFINADQLPWPLWFIAYLPYVMLGALLAKPTSIPTTHCIAQSTTPKHARALFMTTLLLGCIVATALGYAVQRSTLGPEPFYYTYQRLSLPVMLSSILLWHLISRWQLHSLPLLANALVANSFGIYLVHPLWLDLTTGLLQQPALLSLPYAFKLPAQWLLIVIASLLCCLLWQRMKPVYTVSRRT